MLSRLAALLGVVLLAVGCSLLKPEPPSGFVTGTSLHHINVGGHDRSYRLYEPRGASASAPLVVVLHGYSGSARQVERDYGWDELADSAKFVVAYPDGLDRAWDVDGEGCCGRPGREGVDDVAFVSAAVADIAKHVGTNPARVYVSGMSNGGIMAYTLACATDIFAAIGPVAGIQLNECRTPHPVSVMHIHGTADRLVPYGGGQGFSVINGPSVPDVNAFWRNVDRCAAPATTTNGPLTTSTAGCAGSRGVTLITIEAGGHEWPSFAARTLWEFFTAHPR
ncbi:alpha/beta hydrolase family esterase [Mycobacterium paraffinicum]|uniref:PHB depolymerase family esterase n=1 Tax=Mycobacterium paraffinicum TaxID=53378 RepID=A0ABP8F0U1_9MYCO|nr:PHB depolymerase family esterase [Mycobacterium paraffinicum]MCV7312133.1 polyhydroxybutyrate depolymerase [Mycobacterium paraffinicum]